MVAVVPTKMAPLVIFMAALCLASAMNVHNQSEPLELKDSILNGLPEPSLVTPGDVGRLARDGLHQQHLHHLASSIYGAPAGNFDLSPAGSNNHHQAQGPNQQYSAPSLLGPGASFTRPSPSYGTPTSHHHGTSYSVPKPPDNSYGPPVQQANNYHPKPFDTYSPPDQSYKPPASSYDPPQGAKPGYPAPGGSYSSPPFDPYSDPLDGDPWLPAASGSFLGGLDAGLHLPHHGNQYGSHFFSRIPDQVYREKYQFDKFYIAGTEAYLATKWHDCVDQMNKALAAYKAYKWIEVKCRGLCKAEIWKEKLQEQKDQANHHFRRGEVNVTFPGATTFRPTASPTPSATVINPSSTPGEVVSTTATTTTSEPPGPKPPPVIEQEFHYDVISELQTFDALLHETLCINKCKASKLGPVAYHRFKKDVVHHFHELRPYDYLQLCYYKTENYQRAASCAYTFLVAHPGHDVMSSNLQYYSTLHQVNPGYVFNLEAQSYAKLYMRGTRAYTSKRYEDVVEYMEESLAEYLRTEENCKLTCEDALDYHTDGPLKSAVADSLLESIRCKQDCPRRLSNLYGDFQDEFLASHFHYLQFAYYHLNDLKKACEATETYLLLQPYDQTMKYNKEFYGGLPDVDPSYFSPRKDIKKYHDQDELERSILDSMRDGLGKDWTYKSYRSVAAGGVQHPQRGQERFGVTPTEFIRRQGHVDITGAAPTGDIREEAMKLPNQQEFMNQARNFHKRKSGRSMKSSGLENSESNVIEGPIGPEPVELTYEHVN